MKKIIILCLTIVLIGGGCGDRALFLTKIQDKNNTFEMEGAYFKVFSVDVCEISDQNEGNSKLVWEIQSKGWTAWSIFRVTVPEIPDGFVQVIPKPPERFLLRKGQFYEINVHYGGGTGPARFKWIAEW